ncbi:very-long-chain 3-oxoacyl-CoA reductase-like protein At1g24470 [Rutidosis leptorrhynchoides]|uniref:very-long-chain 3-oxoacyl-CoA reductase-like protein At1g24470 n=1 Tax=Rutidosis leptorrhynchoides TaxID=125765 RepID=UPI003A994814
MQPSCLLVFSILGFLSLIKLIFTLLKWIFITFIRPPKNLKNYGSWAMITGATDGIGKAFAFQLAQKGINLILVSRNIDKLKQVSNEVMSVHPTTNIKIFVVDFASNDMKANVREMQEVIDCEKLDVGVLINNVGVTYDTARYFHEVEEEIWMKVMKVNVEGTSYVTKAVIKGMIERKRGGAIVSIGSGAAIVVPSHPLYAIYAASKAYIDQLSRSLHVEYKHIGIDVQCQVPLYVSTKMASQVALVHKPSLFIPTADDYVEAAIRQIGYEFRCAPHWAHSVQWFFASLTPDSFLDAWRLSIGIRRRGLVA